MYCCPATTPWSSRWPAADLPAQQRRWGIVLGAGAAVLLRVIFVGVVARLILLPYLKLVGGVALLVIAAKLIVPEEPDRNEVEAAAHLWRAVMVIVVADIVMSLDNVIAIAAIAHGNLLAAGDRSCASPFH